MAIEQLENLDRIGQSGTGREEWATHVAERWMLKAEVERRSACGPAARVWRHGQASRWRQDL